MASQRDPQNLKNLTKSANLDPQTPFESSFGPFYFRKGSQAVSQDLQSLRNDGFTLVKPSFSEIRFGLEMITFGHLLGAFLHHFPFHGLLNGVQSVQKDSFKKQQKNDQILEAQLAPK